MMTDSQFLTRQDLVTMLSRCLPEVSGINMHSFRIGGASAAASADITDSTIQLLGRWTSDTYRRCLRLSNNTIIGLSQSISWVHNLTRFWLQQSLGSTSGDERFGGCIRLIGSGWLIIVDNFCRLVWLLQFVYSQACRCWQAWVVVVDNYDYALIRCLWH